jgi:cytochrome c
MRAALAAVGTLLSLGLSAGAASAQDAAAGERIFLQCRTCHQVGENARNAVGPHLNGLFDGRNKGSVAGYSYSQAYQNIKDQVWSVENFTTYIKDPRGVTPGTKMVYAGLKDETQIKNLIAYLQQFGPDGKRK